MYTSTTTSKTTRVTITKTITINTRDGGKLAETAPYQQATAYDHARFAFINRCCHRGSGRGRHIIKRFLSRSSKTIPFKYRVNYCYRFNVVFSRSGVCCRWTKRRNLTVGNFIGSDFFFFFALNFFARTASRTANGTRPNVVLRNARTDTPPPVAARDRERWRWRFFAGRARAAQPPATTASPKDHDARALVRFRPETTVFVGAADGARPWCAARAVFNQYSTRARLRNVSLLNIIIYNIRKTRQSFLSLSLSLPLSLCSRKRERAFSPQTNFHFHILPTHARFSFLNNNYTLLR